MSTNGGWNIYPDWKIQRKFSRPGECKETQTVTVKSGQVLKAGTFVESIQTGGADKGKVVAHAGLAESAIVTFKALLAGTTLTLGNLTWTAGASGSTPAQLQAAWKNIAVGTGYAALASITDGGTFTGGTLTGWSTLVRYGTTDAVTFTSSTAASNVTDLAASGTGTAPTISKVDGSTTFNKVVGLLCFDVNASAGDVDASVYTEGSFWADAGDWIVWAADPSVDVVNNSDGTTTAVTAYNTGVLAIDAATTRRLKLQFVEGTEIDLSFSKLGEL